MYTEAVMDPVRHPEPGTVTSPWEGSGLRDYVVHFDTKVRTARKILLTRNSKIAQNEIELFDSVPSLLLPDHTQ
jgi:hypothetical protein